MMRWSLGLCAVLIACGGTESPGPTAEPVPDGAAKLSVQVQVQDGAILRSIAPGETLRSGDKIALSVTVDRPTHLYVLQFFPDGTSAVLFPDSAADQNRVTGTSRVPDSGWFQLDDSIGEENVYVVASVRPLNEADNVVGKLVDTVRVSGSTPIPDSGGPPRDEAPALAQDAGPVGETAARSADAGATTGALVSSLSDAGIKAVGSGNPNRTSQRTGRRKRARPAPGRADLQTRGLVRVNDDDDAPSVEAETDADGLAVIRFHFVHAARE
jgi:hypothetical protein